MKGATLLLAGALLASPALAQAQLSSPDGDKPVRTDVVKVPRGSAVPATRNANGTDRMIDDEMKRIDRMMTICTGC